ncbi:hypothetical protein [Arenicella chitinivorans]|uniref:hypothetical protein n=1 Tax=Arenicella chitinivorans TaxID=1329800 RepID=UPI001671ED73|nr:hypothetical protein [Arenicella chitinivorans]
MDDTDEKASSKWHLYAAGSNAGPLVRDRIENLVPSSSYIYCSGPADSYLFDAMWSDMARIHELIEEGDGEFVWLNAILPHGYLRQADNQSLKAVIGGLLVFLRDENFDSSEVEFLGRRTPLSFVSGCILVFRFCLERDYYHHFSYVLEMADVLIECLSDESISLELSEIGILEEMFIWLYRALFVWCGYSQTGIYYQAFANFPDEESFLLSPSIFHKNYKNISSDIVREYGAEYREDLQSQENAADNASRFDNEFAKL